MASPQLPNPFVIDFRPFAVEPETGVMLTDGLFDATIGRLDIKFHIRNPSTQRFDKISYGLEIVPRDIDIVGIRGGTIYDFEPGSSVLCYFEADFSRAGPGEKSLMIWISGDYVDYQNKNHVKKIFVTKTSYDDNARSYSCDTGRGKLYLTFNEIGVSAELPATSSDYLGPLPKIFVPLKLDTSLIPANPFSSTFECIPFEDPLPLWKAIAALIAALAALAAFIAASKGKGNAKLEIKCEQQPNGTMLCDPSYDTSGGISGNLKLASVLAKVSSFFLGVALKHYRDPWLLGRESFHLAPGELIVEESVQVAQQPIAPIVSGTPYAVDVEWHYKAKTSLGNEYFLDKTEQTNNTDIIEDAYISAPGSVVGLSPIKLGIKPVKIVKPELIFKANEIYCYCLLISPSKKTFKVELEDNGNKYDDQANDGWFGGGIHLEEMIRFIPRSEMAGVWTAYFFVQVINLTPENASPEDATEFLGGNFLVNPAELNYNINQTCPVYPNGVDGKYIRKISVSL